MTLADFDNQGVQFIGMAGSFFAGRTGNCVVSKRLQVCIVRVGWK